MFSSSFDWILTIILAVVSVLLYTGRGDFLLNAFRGSRQDPSKKWDKEKKTKFNKIMGLFTASLALSELVMALFAQKYPMSTLGVLVFMIVSMVITFRYCGKHFR